MFVLHFPQSQSSSQMERWNFNLDSLFHINHAPLISAFCAKLFIFISQPDIIILAANIQRQSDSTGLYNLFACLQQKPSNFIKGRAAGKSMIADLFIPPDSRIFLQCIFFCVVRSHCPDCISSQLSQHHLIPITLIIPARDASESGESGRGNKNSHYREQECKYSKVTPMARATLVTNNIKCLQ